MHAIGILDQYIMARGGWKTDTVLKAVYRNVINDEQKKFTDKINSHFTTMQHEKRKKRRKYGVFTMDLRGIEPLSESLSLAVSPITVADLTFPQQYAHRQAYCFSSFMIHLPGQSLPGKVSHMVDVRFLKCECIRD